MVTERVVRVGGASGAWGDSPRAIPQLLRAEPHYLMMDYLAEVTMSLLARARLKNPEAGFPPDFPMYLRKALPELARRGIKVVSNAGGVNALGCARALRAICDEAGLNLRIAVVEGDDVMPRMQTVHRDDVRDIETGQKLPPRLLTANAYLGALPIAAALAKGADIVVTGRCADSALALGILMHEFGWSADQYDLLAAGSLAGHLLECGPQSTGGTFTDWAQVPGWHDIGYPIAECSSDGSFVLTKPPDTGGLVTFGSVAEQVLYEVGDPRAYVLPDVVADFSRIELRQIAADRMRVSGARGYAPTSEYKVSATYQDGYRATATVSIVGVDAALKAERTAEALLARGRAIFAEEGLSDFTASHTEVLGAEASYGPHSNCRESREVLLRLVVLHPDRGALEMFARELGSVGLSFAPGTTGILGGRPKPTPNIRLFTFLLSKDALAPPRVHIGETEVVTVEVPTAGGYGVPVATTAAPLEREIESTDSVEVPLLELAFARSGDKGNSSNIAVIARRPEYVSVLRREVTADRVAQHFRGLVDGPVRRYEAPGLNAFNFLLENALGGGGMSSLRIDPQGKAYGQRILEMMIRVGRDPNTGRAQ
jgi:hypothetical protein